MEHDLDDQLTRYFSWLARELQVDLHDPGQVDVEVLDSAQVSSGGHPMYGGRKPWTRVMAIAIGAAASIAFVALRAPLTSGPHTATTEAPDTPMTAVAPGMPSSASVATEPSSTDTPTSSAAPQSRGPGSDNCGTIAEPPPMLASGALVGDPIADPPQADGTTTYTWGSGTRWAVSQDLGPSVVSQDAVPEGSPQHLTAGPYEADVAPVGDDSSPAIVEITVDGCLRSYRTPPMTLDEALAYVSGWITAWAGA